MTYRLTALALVAAAALAGCGTRRITDTPRTASEQLLVSAAVDKAVAQLDFAPLADRKVFISDTMLDRTDKSFVVASVRARALAEGVLVVDAADKAELVMELRCGAVGIDRSDYLLGIPATQLPTPFGTAPIPEAAAFKSVDQAGATRISFTVYQRDSRRFFYASGPAYGFSDQHSWWIFGAGPHVRGNVQPDKTEGNTADAAEPMGGTVLQRSHHTPATAPGR